MAHSSTPKFANFSPRLPGAAKRRIRRQRNGQPVVSGLKGGQRIQLCITNLSTELRSSNHHNVRCLREHSNSVMGSDGTSAKEVLLHAIGRNLDCRQGSHPQKKRNERTTVTFLYTSAATFTHPSLFELFSSHAEFNLKLFYSYL